MNKDELIKKAMSELGKRSAKKNKRDYSAMGKKGGRKTASLYSKEHYVEMGRRGGLTKGKKRKPLAERFWSKVEKTDACWNWKGSCIYGGYGKIRYKDKMIFAHRMSWFLAYGKFPEKLVLHKCDNPRCVRPDHLFEGTVLDNIEDCMNKGRSKLPRKLTEAEVVSIREAYSTGTTSMENLAKLYRVSDSAICTVIMRKTYKWVA